MNPEEFAAQRRSLTQQIIDLLVELFSGPGSWRSTDLDVFLEQAVPLVEAGQQQLADLTAVYVASQASEAAGFAIAPPGIPSSAAVNLRKGVDTADVYERPFKTVYNALSEGKSLTEAVGLGETRLSEIVEMDMQQTYAEANRSAMEQLPDGTKPEFWRRVLVGEENCALCTIAATQRYRVKDLNPIHPGCDCEAEGIFGEDPGQVIDEDLLERAHQAVDELLGVSDRGGRSPDYRKITLSMIHEHGEVGPMLARPLDSFTSKKDLKAPAFAG